MTRFAIYNNAANQFFSRFQYDPSSNGVKAQFSKENIWTYETHEESEAVILEILKNLNMTENKTKSLGSDIERDFLIVVSVKIEAV